MDREAWHAAAHGVAKSQTWLSDWTELNCWTVSCQAPLSWDSPGNNTGVGCQFLFQVILTQGWNRHLLFVLSWQADSLSLTSPRKPLFSTSFVINVDFLFMCFFSLPSSLIAQLVKNLPAVQETRVLSLCREELLEKEMAPHSSILAWRIPWTESLAGYSAWDPKE